MMPAKSRPVRHRGAAPWLAGLLILLLGALVLAPSIARAAGNPEVRIVSPLEGSVVANGTAVIVQLLVSNFTLVQPGRVGQVSVPDQGHANVTLDGQLVRLVSDLTPFVLAATSGPHTIVVQLVSDDGTPLSPDVSASVHFNATDGPAGGRPTLAVISPTSGESTGHGFWVSMSISNFTLVAAHGQPNAPNEGHVQVLVLGSVVLETSVYEPVILVAMPDGDINITVRLVNNDNSRLTPDVSVTVPIHVTASSSVSLPLVINGGGTLLLGFTLIVLIIRRRHLERLREKTLREEP